MKDFIISKLKESAELKLSFAEIGAPNVEKAVKIIIESLNSGGKILIFGNGGSAADAQHIAAEFVNRFLKERSPLPAIALTTDTSILTSIGNDSTFEDVFARQIAALGRRGDVGWGITTSGTSPNVVKALRVAKSLGLKTIGLTGRDGGEVGGIVECHINVPHSSTPRVQEVHIAVSHIICELVENTFLNTRPN
jgi:D-sedoheptulose 7-phosphate isomerase